MKCLDEGFAVVEPRLGCLGFALTHPLDLVTHRRGSAAERNGFFIITVRESQCYNVAQSQIAHCLNRRAGAHEAAGLIAKEMIQDSSGSGLKHLHTAEKRARIKIFLAHISERCPVVSAPNF